MTSDDIREKLSKLNPEALLADGLDEALVGIAEVLDRHLAIYDTQAVIDVLHKRDGMALDDAEEFFWFNIAGAFMGPNSPMFYAFQGGVESLQESTEQPENPS